MTPRRQVGGSRNWGQRAEPLIDGVDHVYVPMRDASAAFAVLVGHRRLPPLWPFTSFGAFSSGGVSVGSIKLEVIEANAAAPWCLAQDPPQIQGVAFRPAGPVDGAYLATLDGRAIARTEPERFTRDGKPAWTNVYFTKLIGATAGAFVCDYHAPEPRDVERRRRVLAECDGGCLGVLDAIELVVGTRDLSAASARWQTAVRSAPARGVIHMASTHMASTGWSRDPAHDQWRGGRQPPHPRRAIT